jgi:hypothetical protein
VLLPKDQEPHEQTFHITASHDQIFHIPATTAGASEENQTAGINLLRLRREPNSRDQFIEYQFTKRCNPILSLFSPYQGQNPRNS